MRNAVLSAPAALLGIAVFSATVSPADLGPFGEYWEVRSETPGPERLSPDERSDALVIHPEPTLTYYASVPGHPAHATFLVRPPAAAERIELQINAHNSRRLHVSIHSLDGVRIERDLLQGRLIWSDLPLPQMLTRERRLE